MAHPTDESCIFCKIIAGQIPCYKVYEDDAVLAFLDIGPLVTGHTLVIPKGHYPSLLETPPDVVAEIARRMPAIGAAVTRAAGVKACHFLVNNGAEAQQSVGHLHWHILPRCTGDTFHIPWQAGNLEAATAKALVARISAELAS